MKQFRRSYLAPLALAFALLSSLLFGTQTTGALAASGATKPASPQTGPVHTTNPVADWATIQAGIDGSNYGGTVNVDAGTYVEQLDINKPITLHGAGQGTTIVQSPTSLATKYTTSYPHKPVVFVHGADAVLQNLTIDGNGQGNANNRMMGVDFHNAGGTIDHTSIIHVRNNPFDGVQAGVAVYALTDDSTARTLNVDHSTLSDYQKNGTVFAGTGLNVNFTYNTVTGHGPTAITAQNGIQVSSGATAHISNNTVSGHSYTPFSTVATGMLMVDSDAQVLNNTVSENQVGVYHIDGAATDTGNIVSATGAGTGSAGFWGIIMDAPPPNRQPSPFDTTGGPQNKRAQPQSIQTSTATSNVFTSDGSSGGVALDTDGGYSTPDINFTATGNVINHWDAGLLITQCASGCTGSNFTGVNATGNVIKNNNTGVWVDGGQITGAIQLNHNYVYSNSQFGMNNTATSTTVDGTNNWWGAANGPSSVGSGSGDHVSANITYSPFSPDPPAYAHLQPASPITVTVGQVFPVDLLINAGTHPAHAQQSYLTFTNALLQNVDPITGLPRTVVTTDTTTFESEFQNQVNNGTGEIAYASGTFGSGSAGDHRVAQINFKATTLGDATLHWQFYPPDPVNRNSRITDASNTIVSDRTLYQDYLIHVVHPVFTGHVFWEGRQALYGQPNPHNVLPINLTLTLNGTDYAFNGLTTDANGNFSVNLDALPNGTYTWRVKGPQYLSTSGTVAFTHAVTTSVEMGLQPAGDANNDNLVDILDFGILYANFQQPSPDLRADFNGDGNVDIVDFALLRGNFGRIGNRPVQLPAPKQTGGNAVLELRPQGSAPPNGGTVHVGDRFVLELWVNAQPGTNVVGQQSYLSFPANTLQLGGSPGRVTPDAGVLDLTLQNAICNGPGACTLNGLKVPAGSLAFASGTLNTAGHGAFRLGQVTVQATTVGTARLHWQVGPSAPNTPTSKIATDNGTLATQAAPFVDYVLKVLPAGQ